jgi:Putative adhesin
VHRSFDTPTPPRLRVRVAAGLVSVEPGETAETTVELEALRNDDTTRDAIEHAVVEQRGDEIVVEIEKSGWGLFSRSAKVGIRIRCPHDSYLDCNTASADVSASGRLAEASVKTASGDIALDHVAEVAVTTASGDVRVQELQVDGRVNTVSGDLRVAGVRAVLAAQTVSGDVELGDVDSDVSVQTVSGDQRLRAVRSGDVRLTSVSGDIEVGVVTGTRLYVDASSTSGDVRSELEVGNESEDDVTEAQVRAKTVSGDIALVRTVRLGAS